MGDAVTEQDFEDALQRHCQVVFDREADIEGLRQLTGGANMETWAFDYGGEALILRRRAASPDQDERTPMPLTMEAAIIKRAEAAGVRVPKVYASTGADHALSETILMARLPGEALPQRLFRDPSYHSALARFTKDCAQSLARIHAAAPDGLFDPSEVVSPAEAVARRKELYVRYGGNSPIQALAFRWLEDNLPDTHETTLCHGDFRMGNLLIDQDAMSGVLDWELAFLGDPVSDLGYLCAPCWRFGNYDRPVGGVGQIDEFIAEYERASGRKVDLKRFQFWMIFASLNWSVICMTMVGLWRSGAARELERAVIGTRVSESEIDLLLMLEAATPDGPAIAKTKFSLPDGGLATGDTKSFELAKALSEWLTDDVIKAFEGREQFKARIARNAAGILERHGAMQAEFSYREGNRLSKLGYDNEALCNAIEQGDVTLSTPGLLNHLRLCALERCSIDQPKYAGLKVALETWSPV